MSWGHVGSNPARANAFLSSPLQPEPETMSTAQTTDELQAIDADPRLKLRFSTYRTTAMLIEPSLWLLDLLEVQTQDDSLIARAEFSGSEGCYVEVCRWDEKARRFGRYAFLKCFGGEIGEHTDELKTAMGTALEIATAINMGMLDPQIAAADRHSWAAASRAVVHSLPVYGE